MVYLYLFITFDFSHQYFAYRSYLFLRQGLGSEETIICSHLICVSGTSTQAVSYRLLNHHPFLGTCSSLVAQAGKWSITLGTILSHSQQPGTTASETYFESIHFFPCIFIPPSRTWTPLSPTWIICNSFPIVPTSTFLPFLPQSCFLCSTRGVFFIM